MRIFQLMFFTATGFLMSVGAFAQNTSIKGNTSSASKKQVSTYETSEETIARINRMMNAEVEEPTVTKANQKKSIFVTGEVKTTSSPVKLPTKKTSNPNYCYLTEQLINVANDYKGTRYVWGGTSRNGMDCSGFVKTAFSQFDINLPRTSREMATLGSSINKSEARPGDLVFFKNGGSRVINHVGIVVEVKEDGEIIFIHSATSKGVSVNSTKEPYYSRGFVQVNRVYDRQIL